MIVHDITRRLRYYKANKDKTLKCFVNGYNFIGGVFFWVAFAALFWCHFLAVYHYRNLLRKKNTHKLKLLD